MAFSLRDYTNKMRTINAFECWPFELKEELTQEKINSMLAPMTIPNDSGLVSQNDVLGSQSPQQIDKSNLTKIIPDVNVVASASGEKLPSRSKLRRRSIAEIFNWKKDDEKPPSSLPPVAMPLPSAMPETLNYPLMAPPPQRSMIAHQSPCSSFQIGNLLNVIVLEDDEEEDEQMVSKFRRSKQRLEAPRSKLESLNKILTVASGTNAARDGEHKMENEVEDGVNIKESTTPKEDAAKIKMQNPVTNAPGEIAVHNFLKSCAKQEKSKQLVKNSIAGPEEIHSHVQVPSTFEKDFSGNDEGTANMKANTNDGNLSINIHKRKQVCPIIEKKEFSNAQNFSKSCAEQEKSKQPLKKLKSSSKVSFCDNKLIQFDKGETRILHFSPNVEEKSESFQLSSANRNADVIDKSCSLIEKKKEGVRNNLEHNFNGLSLDSSGKLINFSSSGKLEMNHRGGSQSQISTANMIQPGKFHSNQTQQNRRTNPQGIISQPTLSNSKMNDRKRNHHGTSSAIGVPFSSSPPTSWIFSSTHEGPTWSHHLAIATNLEGNRRGVELGTSVDARRSNLVPLHPRSHLEFDSLNPNGVAKQSQNVDQDSSRCIPSSVPIAATTDSERDLEQQRKLKKHINNW